MKIQNKYWIYLGVQLVSMLLIVSVAFSGSNRIGKLHTVKIKLVGQKTGSELQTQTTGVKHLPKKTAPKVSKRPKKIAPKISERPKKKAPRIHQRPKKTIPRISERPKKTVPKISERPKKTVPQIYQRPKKTIPRLHERPKKTARGFKERSKKIRPHQSASKDETKKTDSRRNESVPKMNTAHVSRAHIAHTALKPQKGLPSVTTKKETRRERRFRSKLNKSGRIQASDPAQKENKTEGKTTRRIATVKSAPVNVSNDVRICIIKGNRTATVPQLDSDEATKANPIYQKGNKGKVEESKVTGVVSSTNIFKTDTKFRGIDLPQIKIIIETENHLKNLKNPSQLAGELNDIGDKNLILDDLGKSNELIEGVRGEGTSTEEILDSLGAGRMNNGSQSPSLESSMPGRPGADPNLMQGEGDDGLERDWSYTKAGVDELKGDLLQGGAGGAWREGSVGFALGCLVTDLIRNVRHADFSGDEVDPVVGGSDEPDDGDDGVVTFGDDEVDPVSGGTPDESGDESDDEPGVGLGDEPDDGDDGVVTFTDDEVDPVGGTDSGGGGSDPDDSGEEPDDTGNDGTTDDGSDDSDDGDDGSTDGGDTETADTGGNDEDEGMPNPDETNYRGGDGGNPEDHIRTAREYVGQPVEDGYTPRPVDADFDPMDYMKDNLDPLIHTTGDEPDDDSESPLDVDVEEEPIPGPSVAQPVPDEEGQHTPGDDPYGLFGRRTPPDGEGGDPRAMDN